MSDKTLWWFISLLKNNKLYYVADTDSEEGTVLWCSDRSEAVKFITKKAVGEFVTKAMRGRTDIYLVNAPIGEQ